MGRRPMRAWCSTYRNCPDPLGNVTTVVNCSLAGMGRRPIRAWCAAFRCCPDPLGNVTAAVNCSLALRCAPHQSLPCVKGGGPPQGGSEGLSRQKCYEYAGGPAKSATPYCTIPQSKIKDFRQPPLHKGALGAAAPVP